MKSIKSSHLKSLNLIVPDSQQEEKNGFLSRTPSANRGLILQERSQGQNIEVHLDWVQGIATGTLERLLEFIKGSTGEEFTISAGSTKKGRKFQGGVAIGTAGTHVYYDDDTEECELLISMPGTPCRRMGTVNTWRFIKGLLCAYKCRFTRLDGKLRVPKYALCLNRMLKECLNKNVKGVRSLPTTMIQYLEYEDKVYECQTLYIGSRESDKYMRIYDPFKLHGISDAWDMELVMKDSYAQAFAEYICEMERTMDNINGFEHSLAVAIASAILQPIQFIDRSADKNSSRCPLLDFWQDLVDLVGYVVKLVRPKKINTVQKNRQWLERAVANSLVMQKTVMGSGAFWKWFTDLLHQKSVHLPIRFEALIREFNNVFVSEEENSLEGLLVGSCMNLA